MSLFNDSTLLYHLSELRKRLIYIVLFTIVASCVAYLNAEKIINLLIEPFHKAAQMTHNAHKLIYTGLPEVFLVQVKVALWSGLIIAMPIILMQIWQFVAPGLYNAEKKIFLSVLLATPLLFVVGILCAYYVVIPNAWRFFLSFEQIATPHVMSIMLEARISEYLNLMIQFLTIFGLGFQLPIILIIISKIGIVSLVQLRKNRRYIFIIILIISAIITPPDVLSMIALAVPLYLLYEITLIILSINCVNKGP